jgi:hypothetical protein
MLLADTEWLLHDTYLHAHETHNCASSVLFCLGL